MRYDFLQVTDETLDLQAPNLARLMGVYLNRKVHKAEALFVLVSLDRMALRNIDESAEPVAVAFDDGALLPEDKAAFMVSVAAEHPLAKAEKLLEALADNSVKALDRVAGGWRVRGLRERYGRFAQRKANMRTASRNNRRARDAGWVPHEGLEWVNEETGVVVKDLKTLVAQLEAEGVL